MKTKVTLSLYSKIISAIIIIALAVGCVLCYSEPIASGVMLVILLSLLIGASIYSPLSVTATPEEVSVNSLMRRTYFPMKGIESATPFQPTMGAIRIFASGGFMGYWGEFREGDIGRYTAFYGRSSRCILLRLRNGAKYVIGTDDPAALADYINTHIPPATTQPNRN